MPPAPSRDWIWYGPSFMPAAQTEMVEVLSVEAICATAGDSRKLGRNPGVSIKDSTSRRIATSGQAASRKAGRAAGESSSADSRMGLIFRHCSGGMRHPQLISLSSQSRAEDQRRLTVATEIPRNSEVSS